MSCVKYEGSRVTPMSSSAQSSRKRMFSDDTRGVSTADAVAVPQNSSRGTLLPSCGERTDGRAFEVGRRLAGPESLEEPRPAVEVPAQLAQLARHDVVGHAAGHLD